MILDKYIRYFLLALFTLLLFPVALYLEPQTGLDPSWKIALHLAHQNDLIFGKDFVFTYGPLGILYSRLPFGVSRITYLLFDLFFLSNVIILLTGVLKKRNIARYLFIFLALLVTMYEAPEQWYFFFMLFHLFSFLQHPDKLIHFILAALLTIICFYIKLSLGLVAIVIFIAFTSYLLIQRGKTRREIVITFFLFILTILISAQGLNVNLTGYIFGGMQLINAYNDAMGIEGDPVFNQYLFLALLVTLGFVSWVFYRLFQIITHHEIVKNTSEVLMLGTLGLYLFILFKSGFVRTDGTHVMYFFRGIIFIASLLFLFPPLKSGQKIVALYSWIVLIISFWSVATMPGVNHYLTPGLVKDKVKQVFNYMTDFQDYRNLAVRDTSHQNPELKRVVGNKSVDILPVEISQAYFNELNYHPRPVIQSYSTYNGYLDEMNSNNYRLRNAPDMLLFSLSSIDNRNPFFDEARTKLAILTNYQFEQVTDNQLVLSKNPQPKKILAATGETQVWKLGEDITIPKTNSLQFTQVFVDYSLLGKLRRLFFKPPELSATLTLDNGDQFKFRAIPSILSGGVILNKLVDSNEEFELLMSTNGALNANVDKVRFESALDYGFKDEVKLTTTHYWLNDSSKMTESDSSLLQAFQFRFQPKVLSDGNPGSIPVRIWIDQLKMHSQLIKISGWAFLENEPNDSSKVSVILKSENHTYELSTKNYLRPDLPEFYKRADVANSAFSSVSVKTALAKGVYTVAIRIVNQSQHIDTISNSDRSIVIE